MYEIPLSAGTSKKLATSFSSSLTGFQPVYLFEVQLDPFSWG